MKIPFSGPDMGMAHEILDSPQIISLIQESRGERVPHDVYPHLNHGLSYHRSDEAVNRFVRQLPFLVGSMLFQGSRGRGAGQEGDEAGGLARRRYRFETILISTLLEQEKEMGGSEVKIGRLSIAKGEKWRVSM